MNTTITSQRKIYRVLIALALSSVLFGCPLLAKPPEPAVVCPPPPPPAVRDYDVPDGFQQADIDRYQSVLRISTDPAAKAKAYLMLSVLHSHMKNPKPDYPSAADSLMNYLKLTPGMASDAELQYRMSILKELARLASLTASSQKDIRSANAESDRLRNDLAQAKSENQKLKETIEKLQRLDRDIERKRIDMLK